jgi:hypothetical protein
MKRIVAVLMAIFAIAAHGQLASVTVNPYPSTTVSPTFMGLSHEWVGGGVSVQNLMGNSAAGVDTIYRQLLANLTAYGNGPIRIRVGAAENNTITTPEPVEPFIELYQYNGAQFTLGDNLRTATLAQAEAIASSYYTQMPAGSLLGIEVGNEDDNYYQNNYTTYYARQSQWFAGIRSVTSPTLMFADPACSTFSCWINWNMPGIMSTNRGVIGLYTTHYYAANTATPAADYLLQPSSYTEPGLLQFQSSAAHHMGMKYIVDEMNTNAQDVSSGTAPSSEFQAALWALQTCFMFASGGIDGVNIHGNFDPDATFNMASISMTAGTPNTYSLTIVRPIYYGLLAFQMATANTGTIYPTNITAGTSSAVSAFDTVDKTGVERMTLVNLDEVNSGNVSVTPNSTYSSATVCYLTASSYTNTNGVTLCGQTFDGSTNGAIQGTVSYTTITPSGGVYAIPLAVTQAAIVKFNP